MKPTNIESARAFLDRAESELDDALIQTNEAIRDLRSIIVGLLFDADVRRRIEQLAILSDLDSLASRYWHD